MALIKTKRKVTYDEGIFKVQGSAGSSTISLATDLLGSNEVINGTPKVTIAGLSWTGTLDSIITITRNSVIIFTLQAGATGFLDFGGQMFPPDNIEDTSDIVVTINNNQGELYIRLRKVAGYKNTDELTLLSG